MAEGAARAARRNNKAPGQYAHCDIETSNKTSKKGYQKLWATAAPARHLSREL